MNRRLEQLALEKQRLAAQSEALRQELAACAAHWKPALGVADLLRQGVDWLRRRPPLLLALAVALFAARPRAVLSLVGRAWVAWRTVRRLVGAVSEARAFGVRFGRGRAAGGTNAEVRRSVS